MQVEIDQSGKIEYTSKHTVLAFSNKENYTILIPAKAKRQVQEFFRKHGRPQLFVYQTFAIGIYLLLRKNAAKIAVVIIDQEYQGHDRIIKNILCELLSLFGHKIPEIHFRRIGKSSNAHKIAYDVFSRRTMVKEIIGYQDVVRLIKFKAK